MINLLLGLAVMIVCLFLQAILLVYASRFYLRKQHLLEEATFLSAMVIIIGVMLILVIGNLLQVGIWAELFVMLGEFETFEQAFYHSAVNFATLGYGDIVMSQHYRLLGALEAINGVLMIGATTATLMTTIQVVSQKLRNK